MTQRFLYWAYQFLSYFALPFLLLRLFLRGFKQPYYRERWRERLGKDLPNIPVNSIWIHAVSVGEVIATRALVEKLRQQYPQHAILMTATTPTGSAQVKKLFHDTVHHCYVPFDCIIPVRRFLKHFKPSIAIVMETELWPTLYTETYRFRIPIILVNARLSQRSFRGYQKVKWLTQGMLQKVLCIAAQSQDDAARFIALGATPAQMIVTGSVKFDTQLPTAFVEAGHTLRASWGQRPVWIAASTHVEEEAGIIAASIAVLEKIPQALCVIVPRHPERFDAVWQQCQKKSLSVVRRSQNETVSADTQIYLGDTLGELFLLYATADVAFVGGSFSNTGGHNILEPALLHLPIVVGPNMFNFAQIIQFFLTAQACIQLSTVQQLAGTVINLLENSQQRMALGDRGAIVVKQHQGALDKLMGVLIPCLASLGEN